MARKRKASEAFGTSARDLLQDWNEYYTSTNFGIGVQCSKCEKWRIIYEFEERKDVPTDWNCSMWKINKKKRGNCSIPSDLTEDDFAQEEYPPGTVVWAKLKGFSWWPAIIEDCPDIQEYFMIHENGEEKYHVTFFGDPPTRSWIKASDVREFDNLPLDSSKKPSKRSRALRISIELAEEATKLPIKERLKKYSFAVRYKGRWAMLKDKDDVSMPPITKRCKKSAKPAGVKSPARKENRTMNGKHRLAQIPHVRKEASGTTMDVDEGQPPSGQVDHCSQTRNVVNDMKKGSGGQKHEQSPGDNRVQTTKKTLFRRDIVRHVKCSQSYQDCKYTRSDSSESIDNGDRNEENPSEENAVSVNEDSEDDLEEQNCEQQRQCPVANEESKAHENKQPRQHDGYEEDYEEHNYIKLRQHASADEDSEDNSEEEMYSQPRQHSDDNEDSEDDGEEEKYIHPRQCADDDENSEDDSEEEKYIQPRQCAAEEDDSEEEKYIQPRQCVAEEDSEDDSEEERYIQPRQHSADDEYSEDDHEEQKYILLRQHATADEDSEDDHEEQRYIQPRQHPDNVYSEDSHKEQRYLQSIQHDADGEVDSEAQNADGVRNKSILASILVEIDDSTISAHSSDSEGKLRYQRAYGDIVTKKYPSCLRKLLSSAEGQMVLTT